MSNERKILYIWVGISFAVGVILGILLFYGQMRSNSAVFESEYIYNTNVKLGDFFRVSYLNMLWVFSIFIAHNILPVSVVHPIIAVRGCAGAFSTMYILTFAGVREAVVSVIPQCLSILPVLALFCVEIVMRRRENIKRGAEPFSLRRRDIVAIFAVCVFAGALETLFFRLLSFCLF